MGNDDAPERSQRLSVLIRQLHGKERRAALERLLRELAPDRLSSSWEMKPLPESDEISRALLGSYQAAHAHGTVTSQDFASAADLREWLRSQLAAVPEDTFYVYFKDSAQIGVLSCPAELLGLVGVDLLYFDEDTIIAMDTTAPRGILLDRTVDDGEETLTAETWG